MRVVIITEGDGEYKALPEIAEQLKRSCGLTLCRVLLAPVVPEAPPPAIAKMCSSRVRIALTARADLIVVTLDREQREECCGALATEVRDVVKQQFANLGGAELAVVMKDRMFENWLISDIDALEAQPGRFGVSRTLITNVVPNRADASDAHALLKKAVKGEEYHKVKDGKKILEKADIMRVAANSRSFRHFLHVLRHPAYKDQCKVPAGAAIPSPRRRTRARRNPAQS